MARYFCGLWCERKSRFHYRSGSNDGDDALSLSLRLAHYSEADEYAMELAQTLAGKMSRNVLFDFVFTFHAILLSII